MHLLLGRADMVAHKATMPAQKGGSVQKGHLMRGGAKMIDYELLAQWAREEPTWEELCEVHAEEELLEDLYRYIELGLDADVYPAEYPIE